MTEIALRLRLSQVVEEYNTKVNKIHELLTILHQTEKDLVTASQMGGVYGGSIRFGHITGHEVNKILLQSAWKYVHKGLNIDIISSAKDRNKFEQALQNPPEFTLDNIKATFGDYILNPRQNILRGLAEVFCALDPYYKSHDKMKIGVKGLPKRVIMSNLRDTYGWGAERLRDVVNALASLQGLPLLEYQELHDLIKKGEVQEIKRGVRLVTYKNGNGHLYFDEKALFDINKGLAEYYGEVIADCPEGEIRKQQSTAVSKDLQYYPTPQKVVEEVLSQISYLKDKKVLEPSCGCGRFLDAIKKQGADVYGIEFDAERAAISRSKGHNVLKVNFLEVEPNPIYDYVIMNPPFYGKHYVKHVQHAFKFLKEGGCLVSILPITARYDHKLLDGKWNDLPVGSFAESGTNINTTVLTMRK